jgi:predicted dehydrogenase
MAKQVRLGIVGLGAQGSMYARLITEGMVPNMKIGAICEPNPAIVEVIESTYPGVGST